MFDNHFDHYLDALAYSCPMPLLKTKQALRHMNVGEVLKVVASDPGSVRDFNAFVKHGNLEMLAMYEYEDQYLYYIRKSA
ncbi:sulfurtransferase TusA family protein [Gammaproteobacteria bacterium AS21]